MFIDMFYLERHWLQLGPITVVTIASPVLGQEYLGLYPYVSVNKAGAKTILFINENPTTYVSFDQWLHGEKPTKGC